jgi:hypothetical protein
LLMDMIARPGPEFRALEWDLRLPRTSSYLR